MKPGHGVASAPFCRLRLIRASPARRAHRALPAESRPDGGGSPAPLISPPASALCPRFCSPLLPSDFHYRYPLIMRAWGERRGGPGPHKEKEKAVCWKTSNYRARAFLVEDSYGFDMAAFHTYGPSRGELLFRFHYRQAGLPGELLPRNEFPKRDSCTSFIICFESNFAAAPRSLRVSSGAQWESTNAMSWLVIAALLQPVRVGNLLLCGHHLF